jgi:hypothetical protein
MITRKQAFTTLKSLNPAPVFLDAYRVEWLPENLDIYFGPPEGFFLAPDMQVHYTQNMLIPILDDGNFGIVTLYDPIDGSLIQKDVEQPEKIRARFENWQQYLAEIFIRIAETIEDDARIRRMGELIQYKYVEQTIALLNCARTKGYEGFGAAKKRFLCEVK